MLRLGIVATGWISKAFYTASKETNKYKVTAVYSRTKEAGENFLKDEEYTTYTDFLTFAKEAEVDVVYIASPNHLHYEQALTLVENKKNIIVEKPSFANVREWQKVYELAAKNNCFIFEGARHIYEKSHQIIQNWIEENKKNINGVFLSFAKYSSKYDDFKNGNIANVFKLESAAGALVDLGVYPVYCAVNWFGKPNFAAYLAKKLNNGVDGSGTIILDYPTFNVTIQVGKVYNSTLSSQIYANKKTLTFDKVQEIEKITEEENGKIINEWNFNLNTFMLEEAEAFYKILKNPKEKENFEKYSYLTLLSRDVLETLETLRYSAQLVFPSDNEK